MNEFELPPFCKEKKEVCDCLITCYPALLLHRFREESKIPKKYWECTPLNLPIEKDNPVTYKHVMRYLANVTEHVPKGIGLYLHSISSQVNLLGTGIGKTTVACTIANHYLRKRIIEHVKGIHTIEDNPVLFLSVATFQNIYNSQFSGSFETKEESAVVFQSLFNMALKTELLILDDIALRGAETFLNYLYQLIDVRNTEMRTIIATSNVPIDKTAELLGERICSRLQESTTPLGFTGKDYRRRSF